MDVFDLDAYVGRSRAVDLSAFDWDEVPRFPLPAAAIKTLLYMQNIESHTIFYLRELLATRVIDDNDITSFLACWLYEETSHGRALARFLEAAGVAVPPCEPSRVPWGAAMQSIGIAWASRVWPNFVAVHMSWGAINELITLHGYRRLAEVANHPTLSALLARITRDESRHFAFYYQQAERRLQQPGVARVTRFLVQHFWEPVGTNIRGLDEARFLSAYLFSGDDGRAAAQKVDQTIRRLPGFEGIPLLESWYDKYVRPTDAVSSASPQAPNQASSASMQALSSAAEHH